MTAETEADAVGIDKLVAVYIKLRDKKSELQKEYSEKESEIDAKMDTIKLAGGEPANFLDIGGGASPERVVRAFRTVLADRNVSVILVNIFAGINRCDWVAEGVVQAYREVGLNLPVVVRLAGTNVEEGKRILEGSGLPLITADTLAEAADRAVAARAKLAA